VPSTYFHRVYPPSSAVVPAPSAKCSGSSHRQSFTMVILASRGNSPERNRATADGLEIRDAATSRDRSPRSKILVAGGLVKGGTLEASNVMLSDFRKLKCAASVRSIRSVMLGVGRNALAEYIVRRSNSGHARAISYVVEVESGRRFKVDRGEISQAKKRRQLVAAYHIVCDRVHCRDVFVIASNPQRPQCGVGQMCARMVENCLNVILVTEAEVFTQFTVDSFGRRLYDSRRNVCRKNTTLPLPIGETRMGGGNRGN
jgi:hypothetical protein